MLCADGVGSLFGRAIFKLATHTSEKEPRFLHCSLRPMRPSQTDLKIQVPTMSIDWFTFTAQILNFAILMWLMNRFLYEPIINAIEQRQSQIDDQFARAESLQEEAESREHEYERQIESLHQRREELLAEAARDVDAWRTEHTRKARDDVQFARFEWESALVRDKQNLITSLQREIAQQSVELSRHVLRQLADADLESRIVARFLQKLSNADSRIIETISETAASGHPLVVETASALTEAHRDDLRSRILSILSRSDAKVMFRTNPDLIGGIELTSSDSRIGWSVREPLAELESDFLDAIDASLPNTEPMPEREVELPA